MTHYKAALALGGMLAATTAWSVFYGQDLMPGRVTSYTATCLARSADNHCTAIGRTFEVAVFQVSVARQQVDRLDEEGRRIPLHSCAVTSRNDWHCRSIDASSEFGFSAGRPWLRIGGAEATDLVFLPRWRYLWVKSGEGDAGRLTSRVQFRP